MQESVEKEMSLLKEKLEQKKDMEVKVGVPKRPVGRPKRSIDTILMKSNVQEQKTATTFKKVRGPYNNWFSPLLWGPIYQAARQHRSILGALKYLQSAYKTPGEEYGPYKDLSRSSMYEWFTPTWEVKDEYKRYIEEGSSHLPREQNYPILSKYPELELAIVEALKAHREA